MITFGELTLYDTVYLKSNGEIKEYLVTGVLQNNPYNKNLITLYLEDPKQGFYSLPEYKQLEEVPKDSHVHEYSEGCLIATNFGCLIFKETVEKTVEQTVEETPLKKTFGELNLGDTVYLFDGAFNKVLTSRVTGLLEDGKDNKMKIFTTGDLKFDDVIRTNQFHDNFYYWKNKRFLIATDIEALRKGLIDRLLPKDFSVEKTDKTFGDLKVGDKIFFYNPLSICNDHSTVLSIHLTDEEDYIEVKLRFVPDKMKLKKTDSLKKYSIPDKCDHYILTFNPEDIIETVLKAFEV